MLDSPRTGSAARAHRPYILGLDIGTNSIGWVALAVDEKGQPANLLTAHARESPSMGVRIFEAGMENLGQGKGREESRAVKRRSARLHRRQLKRRARRRRKIFRLLQQAGLLPAIEKETGGFDAARDSLFKHLDEQLSREFAADEPKLAGDAHERLPYLLRTRGLDQPLTALQLGRALYHLAQRRGFWSNRKADAGDKESGQVKQAIRELDEEMQSTDTETGEVFARTLGEYLFKLDPDTRRARSRWTARGMYKHEFETLWKAQSAHHASVLTPEFKKLLHRAIFHQRPLKSQRHLIGLCEFENGRDRCLEETGELIRTKRRHRAAACLPIAQRFILLQKINDLRLQDKRPGGTSVPLEADQRRILLTALEKAPSLTFAGARKLLGIKKGDNRVFNLEAGGEKKLPGDRTNASFLELFGDRWAALDDRERESAVLELWGGGTDESLEKRAAAAKGVWAKLQPTKEEAKQLSEVRIPQDYVNLSRRALHQLVPELEQGMSYAAAYRKVYGTSMAHEARDTVPPLREVFGDLRNPVVMRALTEVRRVVNAIVAMHGKPETIRVELARDLKKNAEGREQGIKRARENEERRRTMAERIVAETHIQNPRAGDILKARLWEECGGTCPYTGRQINFATLFGESVDIEHIIPFSRSLSDSYANKTLCVADYNRRVKGGRTPVEATGGEGDAWEQMLLRMENNVAERGMPAIKLKLFRMAGEELDDYLASFAERQLSDTRYISRQARTYLTYLYGGSLERGVDGHGVTRVQVGNGQATSLLRHAIPGLNRFLRDGGKKSREDHRHHAVDALATALTGPSLIQRLADMTNSAPPNGRPGRLPRMEEPWPSFASDVDAALDAIWVSGKVQNRVRGPLHKETLYSAPRNKETGHKIDPGVEHSGETVSHLRVQLHMLKQSNVENIVDHAVRAAVQSRLAEAGESNPAKAFKPDEPESYPLFGKSRPRRIHKVRIRKKNSTRPIASGHRRRHVENSENHHLEILCTKNEQGSKKWVGKMVPLAEAYRRRLAKEPVVRRDHGEELEFLFSLAKGDVFRTREPLETGQEFRVRKLKCGATGNIQIFFSELRDARIFGKLPMKGLSLTPGSMQKAGVEKLVLDPVGRIQTCRA